MPVDALVLNKVVGDALLFLGGGNGGADGHFLVTLPGVAGEDLGFKMLCQGHT